MYEYGTASSIRVGAEEMRLVEDGTRDGMMQPLCTVLIRVPYIRVRCWVFPMDLLSFHIPVHMHRYIRVEIHKRAWGYEGDLGFFTQCDNLL